ncbi:hypothetical protein [Neorhizobium sp. NCHU2750]|uniref:hypothetical protein n=1 Tax=Neorhizobium sp. NCHU2750 TaxID=1825976 RepID=UPI0013C43F0E
MFPPATIAMARDRKNPFQTSLIARSSLSRLLSVALLLLFLWLAIYWAISLS